MPTQPTSLISILIIPSKISDPDPKVFKVAHLSTFSQHSLDFTADAVTGETKIFY
jgi:hypothetical protein